MEAAEARPSGLDHSGTPGTGEQSVWEGIAPTNLIPRFAERGMTDVAFGKRARMTTGVHGSKTASTTKPGVKREVSAKPKRKSGGKRALLLDGYVDVALKRRALTPLPIDPVLDQQPLSDSVSQEAWSGRSTQRTAQSAAQNQDQPPFYPSPSSFRHPYPATRGMIVSDTVIGYDSNTNHQSAGSLESLDAARVDQDPAQHMSIDQMTGQPIVQQSFPGVHRQQSSSRQPVSQTISFVHSSHDPVDVQDEYENRAADNAGTHSQSDVEPREPMSFRRVVAGHAPPAPGFLTCSCCPKKPRKFESEEDLR